MERDRKQWYAKLQPLAPINQASHPTTSTPPSHPHHCQVLTLAAVVMPNQDLAFMAAIGWTAINLLMSNFMVRYKDFNQQWFSQLRCGVTVASGGGRDVNRLCGCSSGGDVSVDLSVRSQQTYTPACLLAHLQSAHTHIQ